MFLVENGLVQVEKLCIFCWLAGTLGGGLGSSNGELFVRPKFGFKAHALSRNGTPKFEVGFTSCEDGVIVGMVEGIALHL